MVVAQTAPGRAHLPKTRCRCRGGHSCAQAPAPTKWQDQAVSQAPHDRQSRRWQPPRRGIATGESTPASNPQLSGDHWRSAAKPQNEARIPLTAGTKPQPLCHRVGTGLMGGDVASVARRRRAERPRQCVVRVGGRSSSSADAFDTSCSWWILARMASAPDLPPPEWQAGRRSSHQSQAGWASFASQYARASAGNGPGSVKAPPCCRRRCRDEDADKDVAGGGGR